MSKSDRGGWMVCDGNGTRWYDASGRLVGRAYPFLWRKIFICIAISAAFITAAMLL